MNLVASVPQGLEEALANEIAKLGASDIKTHKRFVSFKCNKRNFFKLHFYSKIAFRFYREVASFYCFDKSSLYEGVQNSFDWLNWLPPQNSFCVTVTGSLPSLSHSHFTALEVKNAIVDLQKSNWGSRSSVSTHDPYLIIHLHLRNDKAILSLPSTLNSLHKRGFRPALGFAPLKENFASGLLQMTGWDGQQPLIDIMCGSGTFLIEGVSHAYDMPIKLQKKYLFENWLDFDKEIFLQEKQKINQNFIHNTSYKNVIGCEINFQVYNQAKKNILMSGMQNYIELHNKDFSELVINQTKGIIICNPPYGKRLGNEKELVNLYSKIGEFLKKNCSGWEFWLLSGNPALTQYLKMKASRKIPVSNGGIDCRWIQYLIR